MRQIIGELKRRAEEGQSAPKVREEARALRNWAEVKIEAKVQIPQVRSIENAIRDLYRQRKVVCSADA
jgi:hypothetical protein